MADAKAPVNYQAQVDARMAEKDKIANLKVTQREVAVSESKNQVETIKTEMPIKSQTTQEPTTKKASISEDPKAPDPAPFRRSSISEDPKAQAPSVTKLSEQQLSDKMHETQKANIKGDMESLKNSESVKKEIAKLQPQVASKATETTKVGSAPAVTAKSQETGIKR